jgi:hypothetical protein
MVKFPVTASYSGLNRFYFIIGLGVAELARTAERFSK